MKRFIKLVELFTVMAVLALTLAGDRGPEAGEKKKPFGFDKVIGFYGDFREKVPSQNFNASGQTWFRVLQNTVEEGSDILVNYTPQPFSIDELGFDYDGSTDLKTIKVLNAARRKKPDLQFAVWQMGGPVAPKLAAVYREHVELVMMETYIDLNDSWKIPFKLQAARLNGLLEKSVIGLGIGKESDELGGWPWTQTKEELEQQFHLIRFVAPESPGVSFFGQWSVDKYPIKAEDIEELCSGFLDIPTDGTGLKPELLKLGKTFTKRYKKPAIFCSSTFVSPNFYPGDPGTNWNGLKATEPLTFRSTMMNLGEQDAKDVIVRLRNRGEGGEVWAKGIVDIPARSIAIVVLSLLPGHEHPDMRNWRIFKPGKSTMEVDAPGCEVLTFLDSRYWK